MTSWWPTTAPGTAPSPRATRWCATGWIAPAISVDAEDFITGWLTPAGALGRPVDILISPDGVIYISDDHAGVVYRVVYEKM